MPKIEYTNNNLPDGEEFRRALRKAMDNYDPVEELLELHTELGEYERRYGISSEECYRRVAAGQMAGDDPDIFEWVWCYKVFVKIKANLKQSLDGIVDAPLYTVPQIVPQIVP